MKKIVLIFLVFCLICCFLPIGVSANQADYTGKIGVSLPTATHGYLGRINWWAKKAIEVVDECVGRIVKRLLELDAHVLVTADHGNAEEMIDPKTKMVKTSHALSPVECIYAARDSLGKKLIPRGKLSDIAPTVLKLLGLTLPKEMTADVLIVD